MKIYANLQTQTDFTRTALQVCNIESWINCKRILETGTREANRYRNSN